MELSKLNQHEFEYKLRGLNAYVNSKTGRLNISFQTFGINLGNFNISMNLIFNSHLNMFENINSIGNYFTHTFNTYICKYDTSFNLEGFSEENYIYIDSNSNIRKFVKYKSINGVDYYYDEYAGSLVLTINNSITQGNKYELIDSFKNKHVFNELGRLVSIKSGINDNIQKIINYNLNGRISSIYDLRKNNKKIEFVYNNDKLMEIKYNNYILEFVYDFSNLVLINLKCGNSFKKMYGFRYNDNSKLDCVIDYSSLELLCFGYQNEKVNNVKKKVLKEKKESYSQHMGDDIILYENNFLFESTLFENNNELILKEENSFIYDESFIRIRDNRNNEVIHYFNTDYELINSLRLNNAITNLYSLEKKYGFDMLDLKDSSRVNKINDQIIDKSSYLRVNSNELYSTEYSNGVFNDRISDLFDGVSPYYEAELMIKFPFANLNNSKVKIEYTYRRASSSQSVIRTTDSVEINKTNANVWQTVRVPILFDYPDVLIESFKLVFSGLENNVFDIAYFYIRPSSISVIKFENDNSNVQLNKIGYKLNPSSERIFFPITKDFYMSYKDFEESMFNSFKALKNDEEYFDLVLCDGRKRILINQLFIEKGNYIYPVYADVLGQSGFSLYNSYMEREGKYIHKKQTIVFDIDENDKYKINYICKDQVRNDYTIDAYSNSLLSSKIYNEYGMILEEVNTSGDKIVFEYDTYGNLVKEDKTLTNEDDDNENIITIYSYDYANDSAKEHLIKAENSDDIIEYTYSDDVIIREKKNEKIKEYKYNFFKDTIREIRLIDANTNEVISTHTINYNKLGIVSRMSDNEYNNHLFEYNDLSLLEKRYENNILKESYNYILNQNYEEEDTVIGNADVVEKTTHSSSSLITQSVFNKYGNIKYKKEDNFVTTYGYDMYQNITEVYDPYTRYTHEYEKNPIYSFLTHRIYNDANTLVYEKDMISSNSIKYIFNDSVIRNTYYEYGDILKGYLLTKTYDSDNSFSENQIDYIYNLEYNSKGLLKEINSKVNNGTVDFTQKISYNKKKDKITKYKYLTDSSESIDNYTYYDDGNIHTINEESDFVYGENNYSLSRTVSYEYDNMNRLISENNSDIANMIYSYNNDGNIKKVTYVGENISKNFAYINGKLSYVSGVGNITYDSYGNMINIGNKNLTYNNRNQLSNLSFSINGTNHSENYYYNYQGIRYKKQICHNNVSTNIEYVLDGNRILKETEKDLDGNILREFKYFYNSRGVCGLRYNNVNYTFIKDLQGNIRKILRGNDVICDYWYDAWGNQLVSLMNQDTQSDDYIVSCKNPFRYRGYYYDVETQLFYCNSRYYSPGICRFISPDDVSYLNPKSVNGLNLYCYCFNNPINYIDPDGHFPWLILAALLLFTPVGGIALQVAISAVSYVGMSVWALGDLIFNEGKGAWADMCSIKWNPFNADEDKVMNSNYLSFYKGVPVLQISGMNGSMSLGLILFDKSQGVEVLKHERGHNTQLMSMGLGNYLIQIGIPSIWKNGDETPWELSASMLGDSALANGYSEEQKREAYNYYIRACFPIINIYNIFKYIFY